MTIKDKWKALAFGHFFYHDDCAKTAAELYDELVDDPAAFAKTNRCDAVCAWEPFQYHSMEELADLVENLAECAQRVEEMQHEEETP